MQQLIFIAIGAACGFVADKLLNEQKPAKPNKDADKGEKPDLQNEAETVIITPAEKAKPDDQNPADLAENGNGDV